MTHSTAVVTGAGSGIGRETAVCLLEAGWAVAALDRDADALSDLKRRYLDAALDVHVVDLAQEGGAERLVGELGQTPVRALVNSAGLAANVAFMDTTPDLFRRIFEINVVAAFSMAKALVPLMEAAGGGAVVNVTSVSGIRGNHGRSAYGASKGALATLTKIMAVELAGRGIRVNAVAPGPIETPMAQAVHTRETRALWHRTVPLGRYGEPREVAEVIRFLIEPERSAYITGQILAADGGFTAAGLIEAH